MALLTRISPPCRLDAAAWIHDCDYRRVESLEELQVWLAPAIRAGGPIAVDLETTGLNVYDPSLQVVGVNLAIAPGRARYVPVGHLTGYELNLSWPAVLGLLVELDQRKVATCWYNAKYDHEVIYRVSGHEVWQRFHEVMFAVWLYRCDEHSFALKSASQRILGLTQPTYAGVTEGRNFRDLHPDEAVSYGCADADCTLRLWLDPRVMRKVYEQSLVYKIERDLILPFRRCLRNASYWDLAYLNRLHELLGGEVKRGGKVVVAASGLLGELQALIHQAAGESVNLDAPIRVGEMLVRLGVPITERTDEGRVATGKEVLAKYKDHPIVSQVVKYRELIAYDRNYIRKLVRAVERFGPELHFAYQQIGAPTGRMSSGGEGRTAFEKGVVDVNIQSTPDSKKKEYLPDVRAALVANDPRLPADDPEASAWEIWALDFSQIELRLGANLSHEPVWIEAFRRGEDIHHVNAQLAYEQRFPRYDAHGHEDPRRGKGKTMGFAVFYGATAETVADHGEISVTQAEQLLRGFFAGAPRLAEWIAMEKARARVERCVRTWSGRQRPLDEYYDRSAPRWLREKGDREAVNSQIQGGAADIFKLAVIAADRTIEKYGWRADVQMLHFLHDEIVFRGRVAKRDAILPVLMAAMSSIRITGHEIPYLCEAEVGPNWGAGLKPYTLPAGSQSLAGAVEPAREARPVAPPPPPPASVRRPYEHSAVAPPAPPATLERD